MLRLWPSHFQPIGMPDMALQRVANSQPLLDGSVTLPQRSQSRTHHLTPEGKAAASNKGINLACLLGGKAEGSFFSRLSCSLGLSPETKSKPIPGICIDMRLVKNNSARSSGDFMSTAPATNPRI